MLKKVLTIKGSYVMNYEHTDWYYAFQEEMYRVL